MNKTEVLARLKKNGTKATLDGMARYGIEAKVAYGVPMGPLLTLSKQLGKDQALSLDLWDTGCYEARLLASLIGDPKEVTLAQMKAWGNSFENWGDGDTVCFKLFDQSPFAWQIVKPWARSSREYTKRAGFALIACLALHDKKARDEKFLELLPLIEEAAEDERNFVKKGVNWALRSIGGRGPVLADAALALSERLAASKNPAPRWIGTDALRQLAGRAERAKSRVTAGNAKAKRVQATSKATRGGAKPSTARSGARLKKL
ncbi:MAG: DNA alkylation repair protein [Vicinamibacteria bacterium]